MAAAMLEPPALEQRPKRYRLSVAQYQGLVASGVLGENDKVELIDGELLEKKAIGDRHAACVDRFTAIFPILLAGRALVRVQNPAKMKGSVPEPDLQMLKPRADFYRSGAPLPADILLLVEVAETSVAFDRGWKAEIYARSGVAEYWVVDLPGAAVWVHRGPQPDGSWSTVEPFRAGAELSPLAFPDAIQPVAEMLL